MKHMAEYLHPGSFFPEETTRRLKAHDPAEALRKAPKSAYSFTLYDVEEPPDLGPDFTVLPKAKNRSATYFIGGHVFTLAEVEALGQSILASNMQGNRWDRVIQCRTGNWQPFTDADVLLDDKASA